VNRTLDRRRSLADDGLRGLSRAPGAAAELLDPALDLAPVILRLLQVRPEALLVGGTLGHGDMRLERGLELLLLAIGLVQVLDELRVALVDIGHREILLRQGEPETPTRRTVQETMLRLGSPPR